MLLLAGIVLEHFFGLKITILVILPLVLLILLVAIFHTYRATIEEIRFQDLRTQAFFNIHSLINPRLPLPYLSGWAAFPELINTIIEQVHINKPDYIVELGSGSSTIITSYLIEEMKKGIITSYDHDQNYGKVTENCLSNHGLSSYAEVILTSLKPISIKGNKYKWYEIDTSSLKNQIDILIVDGPPEKTQKYARYPALPYLYEFLSDKAIVILDDAGRTEEKEIVQMWLKEYPEFTHEYIRSKKGISILRRK
jgi:predicted O-methyltransferase YrrM